MARPRPSLRRPCGCQAGCLRGAAAASPRSRLQPGSWQAVCITAAAHVSAGRCLRSPGSCASCCAERSAPAPVLGPLSLQPAVSRCSLRAPLPSASCFKSHEHAAAGAALLWGAARSRRPHKADWQGATAFQLRHPSCLQPGLLAFPQLSSCSSPVNAMTVCCASRAHSFPRPPGLSCPGGISTETLSSQTALSCPAESWIAGPLQASSSMTFLRLCP